MAATAPSPKKKPSNVLRLTIFWILIVLGAILIYAFTVPQNRLEEVPISQVIEQANNGEISKIVVEGNELTVTPKDSEDPTQRSTKEAGGTLYDQGLETDSPVTVQVKTPSATGDILWNIAIIIVPVILIIAFFMFMMRQAQGQNNQALGFGKSKAKLYGEDKKKPPDLYGVPKSGQIERVDNRSLDHGVHFSYMDLMVQHKKSKGNISVANNTKTIKTTKTKICCFSAKTTLKQKIHH